MGNASRAVEGMLAAFPETESPMIYFEVEDMLPQADSGNHSSWSMVNQGDKYYVSGIFGVSLVVVMMLRVIEPAPRLLSVSTISFDFDPFTLLSIGKARQIIEKLKIRPIDKNKNSFFKRYPSLTQHTSSMSVTHEKLFQQ